ncbi:MAG: M48 family metalloprotease [Desulfobacterales bacterium]|nr:M48 family metalloprotease [Desulfobacterales bacterium]
MKKQGIRFDTVLKKIFTAMMILALITGVVLPATAFGITIKQEEALSVEFMKMVRERYEFVEDPDIVNYVNSVGCTLTSVLPPQPFPFHFYVIRKDEFNAFAAPAGHIFIFTGLLKAMDSEEELAGIMAHEIAHATCLHISESIDQSKKTQIVSLAGIAAGILLGIGGAGELSQAATIGSLAGGQSIAMAYSREYEFQADRYGATYVTLAGYGPEGFLHSLEKIQNRNWFGDEIPTYLSTHPPAKERRNHIVAWRERTQLSGASVDNPARPDVFARTHTRIIALYGDETLAMNQFRNAIAKEPENAMAHYGYGLILARTGNRKDAITHLKAALEAKALDPYMLGDLGRIYYMDGQYEHALDLLDFSARPPSATVESLFYLGSCQMKMEKLDEAEKSLLALLKKDPEYVNAFHVLGEVYYKQDRKGESHYYLGLYYQDKREFKTAIFHLQQALKLTTDPDRKEKIEKKLASMQKKTVKDRNGPGKPDASQHSGF